MDPEEDLQTLEASVTAGDHQAVERVIAKYGPRLRRMIGVRLDPRLARRVDPSDVVQETFIEVQRRLPRYLRERPLPLYPWLRQVAAERLAELADRHIHARKRSVRREVWSLGASDESVAQLARHLAHSGTSPSRHAVRKECQEQIRDALGRLADGDREILLMKFVEQLSTKDTAAILGISPEAVGMRRLRALKRLSDELGEEP